MSRVLALTQLLTRLFSDEELRLHVAAEPDAESLTPVLPGRMVPPMMFAGEVVTALERRGLLDRTFFDRLEDARRQRRAEIRAVRDQWLTGANLSRGATWNDGRYELGGSIGAGGFGLVWDATDTTTQERVVLKILLEHHAEDRKTRQRFFRGAAVLARLNHPGIVRLHSTVRQEGSRYYYVMEFLHGRTLLALMDTPDTTSAQFVDYILQVGEALTYIHREGLLHRDVKPSNIVIVRDQAKLIDFDLITGDAFSAMTTRQLGTSDFTPPEGLTEETKTPAYDVFSLARTAEVVLQRKGGGLPGPVRAALDAALIPRASARTGSVRAFCEALRAAFAKSADNAPVAPLTTGITRPHVSYASDSPWVEPHTSVRFVHIPAGRFRMGRDGGARREGPAHWVRLSPFWLAEVPVTNVLYGRFIAATGRREPVFWRDSRFAADLQPVVAVTWKDAQAFCLWMSERAGIAVALPSEAQWEYAARSTDGRQYPWGDAPPDSTRACYRDSRREGPSDVGSHLAGIGPFGTLDQAGLVWEWCEDGWDGNAYDARKHLDSLDPCVLPANDRRRTLRGGCWADPDDTLLAAVRSSSDGDTVSANFGFRVMIKDCK